MARLIKTPHRRRKEGKTDFKARLRLLKSGKPRLVVRKSSNNISCQLVEYKPKADVTLLSTHSSELEKLGWKFHRGNIPSAYLTGLLFGTKAKSKVKEAVLDLGLQTSVKGSRLYAVLKGAVDAGLNIPHSGDILPSKERLSGKHIADHNKKAGNISKEFEEVKKKILGSKTTEKPAVKKEISEKPAAKKVTEKPTKKTKK